MDGNSACSSKKNSDYSTVARLQKINITEGYDIFYLTVQYCVCMCIDERIILTSITEGYDIFYLTVQYCVCMCIDERIILTTITEGYDILSYCTVLRMYVHR
jgi:hypothetical protein